MTVSSAAPLSSVRDVAVPLNGARRGRLVFDAGTPVLALIGEPAANELLRARFTRLRPVIRASDGEVMVTYPAVVPVFGWIRHALRTPRGRVALNRSIPWELEFRRGVTRLEADLRQLDVRSLVIESGVSHATLRVGRPNGRVRISIVGGVNSLELHRPPGTPIRLAIDGSVGSMTLDRVSLGAIAGRLRRQSSDWSSAGDGFDMNVRGGVSHVDVADDGG